MILTMISNTLHISIKLFEVLRTKVDLVYKKNIGNNVRKNPFALVLSPSGKLFSQ